MSKVHYFDFEHYNKFPTYDKDRFNATRCGYVRKNVTQYIEKVTCKSCLNNMKYKLEALKEYRKEQDKQMQEVYQDVIKSSH